jgi:hypothetical protein
MIFYNNSFCAQISIASMEISSPSPLSVVLISSVGTFITAVILSSMITHLLTFTYLVVMIIILFKHFLFRFCFFLILYSKLIFHNQFSGFKSFFFLLNCGSFLFGSLLFHVLETNVQIHFDAASVFSLETEAVDDVRPTVAINILGANEFFHSLNAHTATQEEGVNLCVQRSSRPPSRHLNLVISSCHRKPYETISLRFVSTPTISRIHLHQQERPAFFKVWILRQELQIERKTKMAFKFGCVFIFHIFRWNNSPT